MAVRSRTHHPAAPALRHRQQTVLPTRMAAVVVTAVLAARELARPGAMGKYRDVRVELVEQYVPEPGPGQVLLRIHTVAVCGSDVHLVQSDCEGYCASSVPADGLDLPGGRRIGHEYTAQVVAVGHGVDAAWLGQWVTGDSLLPCRRCAVCRDRGFNHCLDARLIGLEEDGVFSELAVVPAASLHSLRGLLRAWGDDARTFGCLAEPLGVTAKALHEALRFRRRGAEWSLLVNGGGPLGQLTGLVGRTLGLHPAVVVEPSSARRSLAERLGLYGFDVGELDAWSYRELFGPGAAVVVDACGALDAADLFAAIRPGGVVVSLARTGRNLAWPVDFAMTHGIKHVPSRGHVGYLPWVLRRMADGCLDPRPLATRQLVGLAELADWLRHPERFADHGKVLCRVGG